MIITNSGFTLPNNSCLNIHGNKLYNINNKSITKEASHPKHQVSMLPLQPIIHNKYFNDKIKNKDKIKHI